MNYKEKFKLDDTEEYLWVSLKSQVNEDAYIYITIKTWIYNLSICGLLIAGTHWKIVPVVLAGLILVTWHSFHGIKQVRQQLLWKDKYKSMAEKIEKYSIERPQN